MLTRSLIQRLPQQDRLPLRQGAALVGMVTGFAAYLEYRNFIKLEFLRSEGHYRFNMRVTNCTPWKQMYFTWYRMPEEEYTVYHRFKPYFLLGQLDQSKEVLIPRQKCINGVMQDGFDVLNPMYCYEGGKTHLAKIEDKDPVSVERAAVIIKRGWIPHQYRDKRSRPDEVNSRELVRFTGVWRRGKNIHEYKVPNDPNSNEWNNLCLEDLGQFWDLPNWDEQKYYYFEAVDLGYTQPCSGDFKTPVKASSRDDVIEDHYGWKLNEKTHQMIYRGFGAVSALSLGVFALAL